MTLKHTFLAAIATVLVIAATQPAHAWVRVKNCDKEPRTFYSNVGNWREQHVLPVGGSYQTFGYPVQLGMQPGALSNTFAGNEYCIWNNRLHIQRVMRGRWSH
jgi:hypothetical protein